MIAKFDKGWLWHDRRGATLVEFAFVAPIMIMMLMGLGDLLYTSYAKSILLGAVQKAGRDSAIQGGGENAHAIDNKVVVMIGSIMTTPQRSCAGNPAAGTWCATRESYATFGTVRPEPFTDSNKDGVRDAKECFTDINGNGIWDQDAGKTGQGGSDDVTIYTFRLTFARLFPVSWFMGGNNTMTINASTLLKNQPWSKQVVSTPATVCT